MVYTVTPAGFIDNHCFKTCRPGERASLLLERALITDWKSIHGLKWQTFDLPNGTTADMWDPHTLRGKDLLRLKFSRLIGRLEDERLALHLTSIRRSVGRAVNFGRDVGSSYFFSALLDIFLQSYENNCMTDYANKFLHDGVITFMI